MISMSEQDRALVDREVVSGRVLDYFYGFENAPLAFFYGDGVERGEFTALEQRNLALVDLWMEANNLGSLYNLWYYPIYRDIDALMMALQVYWSGSAQPLPVVEAPLAGGEVVSAESVRARVMDWIRREGAQAVEGLRQVEPFAEHRVLLRAPDRSFHLVNAIPAGNLVFVELIINFTHQGSIRQSPFAVVLFFDTDGTVLIDRTYSDAAMGYPGSPRLEETVLAFSEGRAHQGQTPGALEQYLGRYQRHFIEGPSTPAEQRNLALTRGAWAESYRTLDTTLFHAERFRRQLPLQKLSYKLATHQSLERMTLDKAPDRCVRTVHTRAKGNQVVAECIVSWTDGGTYREQPMLSFLLFDRDGQLVRERSFINLEHWPAARSFADRLDIEQRHCV